MNHYPDSATAAPPATLAPDDDLRRRLCRALESWTPPTPAWEDSPARTRLAARRDAPARPAAPHFHTLLIAPLKALDWLLTPPADVIPRRVDDQYDPRVRVYNRIIGLSHIYTGPQGTLIRLQAATI